MTVDKINSIPDDTPEPENIQVHGGMFKKVFVKEFLFKVLFPALVVILFVNNVYKDTEYKNTGDKIDKALGAGNYKRADGYFKKLIEDDFYNVHFHRGYIKNQLDISSSSSDSNHTADSVYLEYVQYAKDKNPWTADIGHYGLGYFNVSNKEYEAGLKHYQMIINRDLPFLNNSLGFVYEKLDMLDKAKECFYREIEANGTNKAGAGYNLAKLLFDEEDFDELDELLADQEMREYVPRRVIRMVDLKNGRILNYLAGSFHYKYVTKTGLIAALLILAAWLNYLRRLDVFHPEKLRYLLIVLLGGMVFSELCKILYDLMNYGIGLKINGEIFNDLMFCIFGIGLIEETVKIIPFLLMLKFSRQINESIDYVIYAAIPALGFAFMENVMYFHGSGLQNIAGRTLTAVLLHMSLTTIAMYGLFYSKYRKNNKNKVLYFAGSFFAAIVVHGLYDFILINEKVPPGFRIISLLMLIICISKFSLIIRNALNVSEYNIGQTSKIENLSKYLVYSLSGIILLQYFLMAKEYGADNTNATMLRSIGTFYFLMFIIVSMLGNIKITKSKWTGLFEPKNSPTNTDQRAAKSAQAIGADWEYLKGKYAKWEGRIGLSQLALSLLLAALYTFCFWQIARLLHPVEAGSKYVILPAWPIWTVPSLFLGLVTAILIFQRIFKLLIKKEQCREYEIYDKLKNQSKGKVIFYVLSVFIIAINAIIVPLCFGHYIKVHDEGITLSTFTRYGPLDYSYDDIKELKQVMSQKDESGDVSCELYFEIIFNDDYVMTFRNNVYDLSFDEQHEVMKYIDKKCDAELKIVDPYPA